MPRRRSDPKGPSLESMAGLVVGLFATYLTIEGIIPGNKHPIHWLVTAAGGFVGFHTGTIVFRLKERRELYGSFWRRSNNQRKPTGSSKRSSGRR